MSFEMETSDQYEAAIKHLLGLLILSVEKPGIIADLDELKNWLLLTADERDRQGDFGAGRILDRLSRSDLLR